MHGTGYTIYEKLKDIFLIIISSQTFKALGFTIMEEIALAVATVLMKDLTRKAYRLYRERNSNNEGHDNTLNGRLDSKDSSSGNKEPGNTKDS